MALRAPVPGFLWQNKSSWGQWGPEGSRKVFWMWLVLCLFGDFCILGLLKDLKMNHRFGTGTPGL